MTASEIKALHNWYLKNKRPLPWRKNRDPYRIWISETMLQQTTTTAVIPFFERFIKAFPTLKDLAKAPETRVVENWAGLGYYSRARNLHRAAKLLVKNGGFPKSAAELIEYPGLGPYTSRAVSSIAFGEDVGVLDGNVIRILCRKMNWNLEWWKTAPRRQLQDLADQMTQGKFPSHEINQAMMELGATICTPKQAHCTLCPWTKGCKSLKVKKQYELPLKRKKAAKELWAWKPYLVTKGKKIMLVKNQATPFLKNQWLLPSTGEKLSSKPEDFNFKHSITKYSIFVQIDSKERKILKSVHKNAEYIWVTKEELPSYCPSSLVQKVFKNLES